ncbi:hypothetical protein [Campylobacter hyointestinalis]|uniref:Uncharacterized protein n=1 Tax=Campylobacter hyointestinalis subsp. hyointestinalis TaxID=91352 RepID=A0A855NBS8_CAMHY|nr:hypothetical protein [Campylobacter hyointestinalis]PPB58748.1 hypothetical protein CDQ71_00175 [Campylobacter hyointestinalis subsp. hyointestinalis]PPB70057.1 hypothetical protein CDQ78_09285 [Campylobacter hyointestinalis subsp. hyointestinalis]TWO19074.1 hypothetical protein YZ80_07980 [Campylobacter hyointestinalis]
MKDLNRNVKVVYNRGNETHIIEAQHVGSYKGSPLKECELKINDKSSTKIIFTVSEEKPNEIKDIISEEYFSDFDSEGRVYSMFATYFNKEKILVAYDEDEVKNFVEKINKEKK